jgi:MFS family permease
MYLGCNSDTSVSSSAILFIKLGIKEVQEVLVGFLSIVSLLVAVAAGWITDAVGRRWTMAVAALFFLVGALVSVLMLGRVLGVGFALMVLPQLNLPLQVAMAHLFHSQEFSSTVAFSLAT